MNIYFVFLRRPAGQKDRRNDPFWEFGSFGKTGCHKKNLLHPRRSPIRDGDRLAFLQGGRGEIRVVGLTPSVVVAGSTGQLELNWDQGYRPLPYSAAPVLIDNSGQTCFPAVQSLLKDVKRSTLCGGAASKFRSRTTALDSALSSQIMQWFDRQNLPESRMYLEVIQADEEPWRQYAESMGWHTIDERKNSSLAPASLNTTNDIFRLNCGHLGCDMHTPNPAYPNP